MSKRKRRERNYPCVVANCPGRNSTAISLYTIPPEDIEAWCLNLQINAEDVKTTTRVCSRHFENDFKGAQKLKTGARPTLELGKQATIRALPYHINKPRLNPRKCCIAGCNVAQPPGKVYRFPEDPQRREEWLSVCDIKDTALDNKLKFICGKHFDPSCIAHLRLKKDAVPLVQWRKRRNITENAYSHFNHDEDLEGTTDYESDISADCLECDNLCTKCQCGDDYLAKYLEMEKQLKEAEARHLIETLALQSQIEELTAELDKARKFREPFLCDNL